MAAFLAVGAALVAPLSALADGFDYLTVYVGTSSPSRWFMLGDDRDLQGGATQGPCGGNHALVQDLVTSNLVGGDTCGSIAQVAGPLGAGSVDVRYAGIVGTGAGNSVEPSSCSSTACGLDLFLQEGPGAWSGDSSQGFATCFWLLPKMEPSNVSNEVRWFTSPAGGSGGLSSGSLYLGTDDEWGHVAFGESSSASGYGIPSTATSVAFPGSVSKWSEFCLEYLPSGSQLELWIDGGVSVPGGGYAPNKTIALSQSIGGEVYRGYATEFNLDPGEAVWGYGIWRNDTSAHGYTVFTTPASGSAITARAPNGQCYDPGNAQLVPCSVFNGRPWPWVLWAGAFGLNASGLNGGGGSTSTSNSGWSGTTDSSGVPCTPPATQAPLSGQCKLQVGKLSGQDCSQIDTGFLSVGGDFQWLACQIENALVDLGNALIYALDAIIDLIEPGPAVFDPLTAVWTDLQTRAPFSYVTGLLDALTSAFSHGAVAGSIGVGDFSVSPSQLGGLTGPWQAVLSGIVYATTALGLFRMVKRDLAGEAG